ncbi:unnamed protein product [Echinostoma caproni]|uniref:C2H2-type domain-containing protein n=1 Tax=Echinostoma caproni TaxID=27848 RepID=A0A183A954_9TREM|nr:unnamed protein product [Echinostoma caproni]
MKHIDSNTIPAKKIKRELSLTPHEEQSEDCKIELICEPCQVKLTSMTSLRQHQSGKRHMAVVNARMQQQVFAPDKNFTDVDDRNSILSATAAHSADKPELITPMDLNDPFIRPGDNSQGSAMFTPLMAYFCHLCNVPLPDRLSIALHIKGRRHQSLLRSLSANQNKENQLVTPPLEVNNTVCRSNTPFYDNPSTIVPREDEMKQKFVETWVSNATPHSDSGPNVTPLSAIDPLAIKNTVRRVCLTQILSLLGAQLETGQATALPDNQLLALISRKCTDSLYASNDLDENSSCSPLLTKLIQSSLLMSWCQQLTSL